MSIELGARAPIYAWLAERLVREISPDDWHRIGEEPIRSILLRLEGDLAPSIDAGLSPVEHEALEEEFARLFLLPGGVSPMASAWVAREEEREAARAKITAAVEYGFRAIGRQPVTLEPWGRLPLEHLGIVLDLTAVAALSENAADFEVADLLDRELLAPSLDGFGAAVARHSEAPVYRAIGALIRSLTAAA